MLRDCDQSLEEVESRSPACSCPKDQAALEEAEERCRAPFYGMKKVSTAMTRGANRQQKRLRKAGKPQQVSTTFKTSLTSEFDQSKLLKGRRNKMQWHYTKGRQGDLPPQSTCPRLEDGQGNCSSPVTARRHPDMLQKQGKCGAGQRTDSSPIFQALDLKLFPVGWAGGRRKAPCA